MAYITKAGESIAGIVLRQLANKTRWQEIRELNEYRHPGMIGTDYYQLAQLLYYQTWMSVTLAKMARSS